MAWLSREQSGGISVPHILGLTGDLLYSPDEINRCFVDFYRSLYSSRADYREEDLMDYLADTDIPVLTSTYLNRLDAPITVVEVLKALRTLQTGKMPGA